MRGDTGFTNPSYLSIDSNNRLNVAQNAVTEDTTLLVKFLASNDVGATSFEFYLTIIADASPVWADVDSIPMATGDVLDLFKLAPKANTITWRSSFTQPSDTDLTDGKFAFTGVPSASRIEVQFTATNPYGSTHIAFYIDIVKSSRQVAYSDTVRHRLEIQGIDVTDDLVVGTDAEGNRRNSVFQVQERLDVIRVNTITVGKCELTTQ